MTRETKIGLLVGLAFIIVIGILLSDHLTSSTEPPPATLANAGNSVRQTVTSPGSNNPAVPPITNIAAPHAVAPQQPVLTTSELQPRPQPVQIVQIGGPSGAPQQQQQPTQEWSPQVSASSPVVNGPQGSAGQPLAMSTDQLSLSSSSPREPQVRANDAPVITQAPLQAQPQPQANLNSALAHVAQQHGEGLVALDAAGRPTQSTVAPSWATALTGLKEYKAEPGDSVSKLAMKHMNGNTKANRDAIVRANPSLQQDVNKVIVGRTYLIPTSGDAPRPVAAAGNGQQAPQSQPAPSQPTGASATEYFYTVKENDSLWKIANDQLGSAGAIAAIKELNKDALRGGETVFVGMKLRLPGKPLAKAN